MTVDVNVSLSRWPFRRLPDDDTPRLVRKLKSADVRQAWAGSFDALLHKDIAAVNSRLADDCRQNGAGMLVPFGAVNPMLPDWRDDVRRCHEEHGMPGIRLHPNYHGYALDQPVFRELLAEAEQRKLIVQLAVEMEDERTQHPLVQVAPVDMKPLPELLTHFPALKLVVINGLRRRDATVNTLAATRQVWFDISMLESVGGIERLVADFPFERVLFGSHAPFYYLEAADLKFRESALGAHIETAIRSGNAQRLLTG